MSPIETLRSSSSCSYRRRWQGVGQCRPLKPCTTRPAATFTLFVDRELGNVAHWNPSYWQAYTFPAVDRELGNVAHWNGHFEGCNWVMLTGSWAMSPIETSYISQISYQSIDVDRELGNVAHWNPQYNWHWDGLPRWQGVGQCRPLKHRSVWINQKWSWQGVGQCRPLKPKPAVSAAKPALTGSWAMSPIETWYTASGRHALSWQGVGQCRPLKRCWSSYFSWRLTGSWAMSPIETQTQIEYVLEVDRELGNVAHWNHQFLPHLP